MIVIDKNTVVVFSSSELKDSLANNNGYSYIYLGADISLESWIVISNTNSLVVIDGTYEGAKSVRFTVKVFVVLSYVYCSEVVF